MENSFIDLDLGLGGLNALNTISMPRPEDDAIYWTTIASRIRAFVQSFKPQITQLVLTGSSATDERFIAVVRDALQDVVAESASEILLDEDMATNDYEMDRGQVADFESIIINVKAYDQAHKRGSAWLKYTEKVDKLLRILKQFLASKQSNSDVSLLILGGLRFIVNEI